MSRDVIVTPASGLIDFLNSSSSRAQIQLGVDNNLTISNSGGSLTLGNTAANVYIGDGTNSVDVIFEQNGKIRGLTNKTVTLGQSDSFVNIDAPLGFISPNASHTITAKMLNTDVLSFQGNSGELLSLSDSMTGTIFTVNDVSGIPSIEVLDTGTIRLAQYGGNVGIGIANPAYKLDVYGELRIGTTGKLNLNNDGSNAAWINGTGNSLFYTPISTQYIWHINNVAVARINSAGLVGIGSETPSYKLDVVGSGGINQSIYSRATDGSMSRFGLQNSNRHWTISNYGTAFAPNGTFNIADETVGQVRFHIGIDGRIGIGTTSPGHLLNVNGTARVTSLGVGTDASGTTGEIRATNEVTAYYSDERLKTFDGRISNALEKISMINGYYFYENELAKSLGYDNSKRQAGVSAQEIERILPEAVCPAPISDKYLTVKYDRLIPLLIEAIKDLAEELRVLKENKKY